MIKKRFGTLRAVVAIVCLAGVYVLAMGDTLKTNEKPVVYRFNATYVTAGGVTTYMDGSKRIRAYPIGEDTTGAGTDCYYIGTSRKLFGLQVDSTDVFKFYETTGIDSVVLGMDSVLVWNTIVGAPEGFISTYRAFGDTCVSTAALKLLSVTTARIAADAVDSSKVSAIASSDIIDGQVKAADIQNLTITSGKLAAGAVGDSSKIAASAVTQTRIASGAVTHAKLADTAIDSSNVPAGALSLSDLNILGSRSVGRTLVALSSTRAAWDYPDSTQVLRYAGNGNLYLQDNLYVTHQAYFDSVGFGSALGSAGNVPVNQGAGHTHWTAPDSAIFVAGTLAWGDIAGALPDSSRLRAGVVTSAKIVDGQVKNADLEALAVTAAKLTALAIADSAKLGAGIVGSSTILDGQVKLADLGAGSVDSSKVAAGALARSDFSIGGTATSGYAPKSTGDGWAWGAVDDTTNLVTENETSPVTLTKTLHVNGQINADMDVILGAGSVQALYGFSSGTGNYVASDDTLYSHGGGLFAHRLKVGSSGALDRLTVNGTISCDDAISGVGLSTSSVFTAGDAVGDTISLVGTVSAADAKHLKIKNQGGTGTTTVKAPRITSAVTANLGIWGRVTTDWKGHASVYVPGMTGDGLAVASALVHIHTTVTQPVIAMCWLETDSVIVNATCISSDAGDPPAAWAGDVVYQYTMP
jgi:hypothetical protein